MEAKRGVDLRTLSSEAWWAAHKADQLHLAETGKPVTITSTTEGKHSVERSAHYRGDAVDVRIWHLSDPEAFTKKLKRSLGKHYVVLLENTHIHIHWSPVWQSEPTTQ